MTTTQLILAYFVGSFLNTVFWGSFSVLARVYVHYRDKPLREKLRKDQEAFEKLLSGAYSNQFDFEGSDKPGSVN